VEITSKIDRIAVVGGGGWGSALAIVASQNFKVVKIFTRDAEVAEEINTKRTNECFIPGAVFPQNIIAVTEGKDLNDCTFLINTVPSQFIKHHYTEKQINLENKYIINGSKGIDTELLSTISKVFKKFYDVPKHRFAILVGPSHAEEVVKGLPTTVVCASQNMLFALFVQENLCTPAFRVYTSQDVIGCEIGSSIKNVIAIAAGINDGLGLGDNTKAALITRGLAEITRLGVAMGASPQTFSGLSGLGDLVVTCNSIHSRNRGLGERIGKGEKTSDILKNQKIVVEGVETAKAIFNLSQKIDIEMPIVEQVYRIIFEDKSPSLALQDLMARESKSEWY